LNAVKWVAGGGQVAGGRPNGAAPGADPSLSYKRRPNNKRAVDADGNASPGKRRRPSGEMRRVFRDDGTFSLRSIPC
jgi:hypothetical protein